MLGVPRFPFSSLPVSLTEKCIYQEFGWGYKNGQVMLTMREEEEEEERSHSIPQRDLAIGFELLDRLCFFFYQAD